MKKRNLERMRYKNDRLSANLVLISIVCNVVFFVTLYSNSSVVPDYQIGMDVIINLLFLLIAFLAGEEAKVYTQKWAFVIFALAVVQAARIFWLPEHFNQLEQLIDGAYLRARYSMILSAAFMFAAAVTSYSNSTALRKYLNGLGA
jgi:anaerobic C4-dicarboxylate transporter